jgi:hypothetical protein
LIRKKIKEFFDRFSVQKMYDDLDYWIFIGIGDDIVDLGSQRAEYERLVKRAIWDRERSSDGIPKAVLSYLQEETLKPWYLCPTFWHLVWLNFKRLLRII